VKQEERKIVYGDWPNLSIECYQDTNFSSFITAYPFTHSSIEKYLWTEDFIIIIKKNDDTCRTLLIYFFLLSYPPPASVINKVNCVYDSSSISFQHL
jgi:hypothetical protein